MRIHRTRSTATFVEILKTETARLLGAEHVLAYLYDPRWRDLHGRRAAGEDDFRFPVGRGLAGRAAEKLSPVRTRNAPHEPGYVAEIDSPASGSAPALLAVPLVGESGGCLGVVEAFSPAERPFDDEAERKAVAFAGHVSVTLERLRELEREREFLLDLLATLADALDRRSSWTFDHSYRVREYCRRLGRAAELDATAQFELEFAALLHDIGRMEVDFGERPGGGPDEHALERMKPHVLFAEALLRGVSFPESLSRVPDAVLRHHEFLDGSGYPKGRKGKEISDLARMLCVADSFDSYLHDRGPRAAGSPEGGEAAQEAEALRRLKTGAGTIFDARYVRLFVEHNCHAIEQRRFPRIEYRTPVEVRVLGPDGSEVRRFETEALDLSEGGILLESEERIEPHTPLGLVVNLPSERIEAVAKVARVLTSDGPGCRIGAYFLWYDRVGS